MQPKINNTIIDLKARQLTGLCKQSTVTSAAFEGPANFHTVHFHPHDLNHQLSYMYK